MSKKLDGQRVLITGGSAGLGAAVARKFASEGANIAINYASSKAQAESLQQELSEAFASAKIIVLQGDVSKRAVCEELVKSTVEQLGGIDCIVSNAGWTKFTQWDDLDAFSEEEWDRCFAYAKPHFLGNPNGGSMIITTSVAGVKQVGSALAYSVTKHGAIALARGLALHQGPKCRVNTVAPGLLETDWATKQYGEALIKQYRGMSPLEKVHASEL